MDIKHQENMNFTQVLQKLLDRHRSKECDNDDLLIHFALYKNKSIKFLRKEIPPQKWHNYKSTKITNIANKNCQFYKIFYLKENESIFWSENELAAGCSPYLSRSPATNDAQNEVKEKFIILNGSCTFQIGQKITKHQADNTKTNFIPVKNSSTAKSISTNKNEQVVVGYVQSAVHMLKPGSELAFTDLKYSYRARRASLVSENIFSVENSLLSKSDWDAPNVCSSVKSERKFLKIFEQLRHKKQSTSRIRRFSVASI